MGVTKCVHLDRDVTPTPNTDGCEKCLATDGNWVHLRLCRTCGHVGCCDSSPGKHSTKHFQTTKHPIIQSFEPGEDWGWCFECNTKLGPFEPART